MYVFSFNEVWFGHLWMCLLHSSDHISKCAAW